MTRLKRTLESLAAIRLDLRHAFRTLRREVGVSTLAIAVAGIGIGASTTVFSLCQALLLRPLPFHEPERLVWVANGTSENLSAQTVQVSNLEALVAQSRAFSGIAGFSPFYGPGDVRLTDARTGDPERITSVPITRTLLPLLGVRPLLGRNFDETESRFGATRTALLDYRFFQRRFGGDAQVLGRPIMLDGDMVTVIGVLPGEFEFGATFTPGRDADVFVPFPLSPETNRQGNTLALIGRLRDDARLDVAQVEASSIAERLPSGRIGDTWRNKLEPRLAPLRARVTGRFRPALFALAGAVGFLMLLVCANLSNLLLVRASVRRRELAIRAALGATRAHLIRQTLAESLLLGAGGTALGLALAIVATRLVSHLQGTTIPLLSDVRVDAAVFGFAALLTIATTMAFGVLPALQVVRFAEPLSLNDDGRGSTAWRSGWLRRAVVVAEIAMVCVLLTGAGLLARSLRSVLDVSPGFTTQNVVSLRVDPARGQLTAAERRAYLDALVQAVRPLPGVAVVGLTDALPLGDNFGWRRWGARVIGRPDDEPGRFQPLVRMVDAGYFATMRIPLRAGRAFTDADVPGSEPVVILNEALASAMWPGLDPVGRLMQAGGTERRVVGVVGGVRYFSLDRAVEGEMYMPVGHPGGFSSVDLVVRGTIPTTALVGSVREALRRVDPALPVAAIRTMNDLIDRSLFARRFVVVLVGGFAGFGLLLSALGIYAVVSYSVSQRTREIGIRMALGATAGAVRWRILDETGRLALAGLGLGLPLAWIAARAIRSLLFGVGVSDPLTFVGVCITLAATALLAAHLPARRATRVDPVVALRAR